MEILECPLYKECKEEECPYFENEDCTYYIKKEQETEQSFALLVNLVSLFYKYRKQYLL